MKARLPIDRFHSLRHSSAVMMLTSGVDVKTVASRLGHADPALLFSTYSHFIESADRVRPNASRRCSGRRLLTRC